MLDFPSPLERLQGAQFVNVFEHSSNPQSWSGNMAQSEDLLIMAQRILGAREAQSLFISEAQRQGVSGYLPEPDPQFLQSLERRLAGSVGAATAHAMIGQIVGGTSVSVEDLLAVADETAQMMEYSSQLEAKSDEQMRTARQLRRANEKLTQLSLQKDAFLSQISHELRTPMTSIRAFSEILRDSGQMENAEKARFASIIHDEAVRLTRLLDDLLDLSVLENGQVTLDVQTVTLSDVMDQSIAAALSGDAGHRLTLRRKRVDEDVVVTTDPSRLSQVFINLIANASKYCDAEDPKLSIVVTSDRDKFNIDFIDNGSGISKEDQDLVFEKFARVGEQQAGGAGLGLAICREIMLRLGGEVSYLPGQGGGAFRVSLPVGAPVSDIAGSQ
jgi:signal transduction histidine kinase